MIGQYKKYHLGCGPIYVPGYLNIDYTTHVGENSLHQDYGVVGATFYNYNLVNGLPAAENSLEVIYTCHFLEHLSFSEGFGLLEACYRCLEPGGTLRLLVPDLELWIKNYLFNNKYFFDEYRSHFLNFDQHLYESNGAVLIGMLHNWGHKSSYDYETLTMRLNRIGFKSIHRTLFQESSLPEIATLEPYVASRAMESLCVECIK